MSAIASVNFLIEECGSVCVRLRETGTDKTTDMQGLRAVIPVDTRDGNPWVSFFLANHASTPDQAIAELKRAYARFVRKKDDTGLVLAWCAIVKRLLCTSGAPLDFEQCLTEYARRVERAALSIQELHFRVESLHVHALVARAIRRLGDTRCPCRESVNRIRAAFAAARSAECRSFPYAAPLQLARCAVIALEHGIEPAFMAEVVRCLQAGAAPGIPLEEELYPVTVRTLGQFDIKLPDGARSEHRRRRSVEQLLKAFARLGSRTTVQNLARAARYGGDNGHIRKVIGNAARRLNRHLGLDAIVVRGDAVCLSANIVWIDAIEFRSIARQLDHLTSESRRESEPEIRIDMQRLLRIYRGKFLAEESSSGAREIDIERKGLDFLFVETLRKVAGYYEQMGLPTIAEEWLRRALGADPASEDLHAQLIACIAKRSASEARRAYARCEAALAAAGLGTPSARTRALAGV